MAREAHRTHLRSRAQRGAEEGVRKLLSSLGVKLEGELLDTPARAARLWCEHLLAGEHVDPKSALGHGSASLARAPVTLLDVGVHLVCPHHLTVAFGEASVAYLPRGRVAGFSALARLIDACTARLVLQEDACQQIAQTLVTRLNARAAVAMIEAQHPCAGVPHGRSHRARALTIGASGDPTAARDLLRLLNSRPRAPHGALRRPSPARARR